MNRYIQNIGNTIAGLSLLVGSAMTMQGTALLGSLSGQGTTLHGAARLEATTDSLTPLQQADASIELMFGMLLILLGFFLHAYIRARGERRVHITVKPSKKRVERLFWMRIEM